MDEGKEDGVWPHMPLNYKPGEVLAKTVRKESVGNTEPIRRGALVLHSHHSMGDAFTLHFGNGYTHVSCVLHCEGSRM